MEGIDGTKVAEYPEEMEKQIDVKFSRVIIERAVAAVDMLPNQDAAASFYHIMLDAVAYQSYLDDQASVQKPLVMSIKRLLAEKARENRAGAK